MNAANQGPGRKSLAVVWAVGVIVGVVVAVATSDVILGVICGAPCVVIGVGLLRLWTGGSAASSSSSGKSRGSRTA